MPIKTPKTVDRSEGMWRFIRHGFQKAAVSPVPTRRGEFQKRVFFEVVVMGVFRAFFGRFSVDDKQKRTKTYGPVI